MPEITVSLDTPGMTPLHRAGVAGLYMTVRAMKQRGVTVEGWDGFTATARDVTLRWTGPAKAFFDRFVKASYRIARNGLVDFVAIEEAKASMASRWVAHEGMFGTFCQFGPNNGLGPAKTVSLDTDGGPPLHFEYRPVDPSASSRGRSYPHRDSGGEDIGTAIDKAGTVELASWLFPGAVVRHNAFSKETKLDEDPARALALLYAPVGCFFFKIDSRRQGRKARFALLIPDIGDLQVYADARTGAFSDIKVGDVISSGAGDAALRLLTRLRARDIARDAGLPQVTVLLLGIVVWNEKQKSRTGIMDVRVRSDRALRRFGLLLQHLHSRTGTKKDGTSYLLPPATLELFADNLALGRPFYEDFASLVMNKETRDWLAADQKGLSAVIKKESETMFDDAMEKVFVEACHDALRACFRIVAERAKADRVDMRPRFQKEYDRWRNAFARAKSADIFREAIADFWSRGGANRTLREHWKQVLPLMGPQRWKQGRDLALLALASYPRAEHETEDGNNETTGNTEDQQS